MARKTSTRTPEPKRHDRAWGEGSVREVRPGVYRAERARDSRGHRASHTFKGADAEQRAVVWARGDPEPTVLYLGAHLESWLALRRPTLDPSTFDLYRRAVVACSPLALRPLAAITVAEWQQLTNSLLGRWSRYHVQIWRGNVSTALRAAIPEHLTSNPLARVTLPKRDEQPPKAWRQDEIDRLLSVSVNGIHEPWLLFSLGTGVRLGESRALLWEDVDLVNRTATIRASLDNQTSVRGSTKTGRVRVIDVPDDVVQILSALRMRQPARQRLVFGREDGRAYRPSTYRKWLRYRCRDAGVTLLPPHSLRHTCASLAFARRVPVPDVAHQLGHTVQVCTRTYSHFINEGQRIMADALGAALRNRFSGPERAPGANIGAQDRA